MLPEYFAVIGAIIASLGGLLYFYDTLRGKTKPNRMTWLLWGILPMITFVAQRVQGVEGLSWATFVSGFTPLFVVAASFFNRKAYWKTQPLDYGCMVLALIGIGLWAFTRQPNLAICFSIVADFAAGMPTVLKAAKHPETESWRAYMLSTTGFVVALLSVHEWTFANYAFVAYLVIMNGLIGLLATRGDARPRT
jgi:hypothetical protein